MRLLLRVLGGTAAGTLPAAGLIAAGAALPLLAVPHLAGAQTDQTGLLRGTVTTSAGRPVGGAAVSVAQSDGSYARSVQSDPDGSFRVNFLTPGTYTVRVRQIGYRPVEVRGVVLRATQATPLAVRLTEAVAALQTVEVTAASPVTISRATNEVANTTVGERERELLPTPRDANGLIQFTPGGRAGGVTNAQLYGGSGDQANLWQVDGVTANQPGRGGAFLLPNVDWVQSIEVRGLGAGAEYGNFQGGLINIVTKSGSNTLQGALRGFYESQGLNASNVNAFELGSQLANRYEVNGEVRGPIVRDRLYYYLSGQDALRNTEVVDAVTSSGAGNVQFLPTFQATRDQRFLGKLTWQAAANDIVNASLGYVGTRTQRSGLSAFDGPEATYRLRQPTAFYNLSYQRTFSSRTFVEAKVSGYQGRDDQLPYNGSAVPAVKVLGQQGQFRNSFYTRNNRPGSTSALLNLDTYRTLAGMEHHLKVGGEYNVGTWREQRTRNGNLTWYYAPRAEGTRAADASNPANWQDLGFGDGTYATTDWGGAIDLNARADNGSLWVQDYIAVTPRLSIAPGLRFGSWTGYLTPGNGGGARGTDRFRAVSARAVDPRIGANFDVLGNNSLVVKAHWGRYRQSLFALMFDRAPGGNVFTNIEYYDWKDKTKAALPDLTRTYTEAERAQLFDAAGGSSLFAEARAFEGYRQPYMDQATLGFDKALGRRYRAEVVYVNRRNRDVLSLVDRNLANNFTRLTDVTVVQTAGGAPLLDQDGRPLVLRELYVRNDDLRARVRAGNNIPGFTRADTARIAFNPDLVVTTVPEARRRFDQLQFQLTGALTRVNFNAAVALTRLRGNVFSVNGYDNPLGQGAGPFVTPNGRINFDGNLDNYSPVDVKLRASGQLPLGFQGGAFFAYASGDRYTPSFALDRRALTFRVAGASGPVNLPSTLFTNTDGQGIYLAERGSRALPALSQLDLRLERAVPVRGAARAVVGLEMFNVFNTNTVTDVKTTVNNVNVNNPNTLFGAPNLRQFPRTIRLNTQLRF
jgi:hypothetical protein